MKRKLYTGSVDYEHHAGVRKKLAYYLKAGSFKQIGGEMILAKRIRRNRLILLIITFLLTMMGLYHAFS